MKTLKRTVLTTAMLAAAGATGIASAVHVNPTGLGQALIYPYYTVRNAGGTYNTYLSVVNTMASTKAVKVRFLEGKNGKAVLDFNLYLSPFDVWTGAVVPVNASDATQGAKLVTADNSCTTPAYKGNETQFVFSNAAYAGLDAETASLDRTNEGHFEIIEMGDVTGTITTGIKHTYLGVPANCGVLTDAAISAATKAGSGGLSGTASLINVASGTDYGYNPVALGDFNLTASTWTPTGNALPNLGSAQPKVSRLLDENGEVVISSWDAPTDKPADPVSAVLMFYNVINEFVLDTVTLSGTDWVVTFPTKSFYVGNDVVVAGVRQNTAATRPFQRNFGVGGACDEVEFSPFDRESQVRAAVSYLSSMPGYTPPSLCWQANVVTFNNAAGVNSNLLGSTNTRVVDYLYQNGWTNLSFPLVAAYFNAHQMQTAAGATTRLNKTSGGSAPTYTIGAAQYFGLPIVGFMLQNFINGNVGSPPVMSSYGGNFDHKTTRLVNVF